ncbi:MAG: ISNCY family transposase [Chloroflexota bacterium]
MHEARGEVVLTRLIAGRLSVEDAALLLGLSPRSIRRLRAAFLDRGAPALVHGNRGRASAHRLDPALVARVVTLARDQYRGVNDSHFTDLLRERECITLSRASVQRILRGAGIPSPRHHRVRAYRSRRERRAAEGMLLQVDASRHRWFGAQQRHASLVGAIDDATGKVFGATFREQEDAAGYLSVLGQVLGHGVPLAVYSDRHSIFFGSPRTRETIEEELLGRREPTQVGRAFAECGTELIFAHSPQAKGRIERLWGTFQDRLVVELRLAGIRSIEAANAFLPSYLVRHNARFAVAAADAQPAWRALPDDHSIASICCLKFSRLVAADNTVGFEGLTLQLPPKIRGGWAHQRVEIRQHLDGTVAVHAPGGQLLARSATPAVPPRLRVRDYTRAPVAGVQPLPRNIDRSHPWRQWQGGFSKRKMRRADGA